MEVLQVSTNHHDEFSILKDTVWKLSSRVLLLEGFIRNQFGTVFWQFCEDQVNAAESGEEEVYGQESGDDEEVEESSVGDEQQQQIETKVFSTISTMPSMIPIHGGTTTTTTTMGPGIVGTSTAASTSTPSSASLLNNNQNHFTTGSSGGLVGTNTVNKSSKPIPPPPPLSCMKSSSENNNSSSSPSTYQYKPRNFLPKSLAAKPKLFSAASSSSSPTSSSNNGAAAGFSSSKQDQQLVLKESSTAVDSLGAANHHNNSESANESPVRSIKTEPIMSILRKSPATVVSVSKQNMRPTFKNDAPIIQAHLQHGKSFGNLTSRKAPLFQNRNNFHEAEFVQDLNVPFDSESEEDPEGVGYDGFLASDLVATSLAADARDGPTPKRMKYSSFTTPASSSSGTSLNGSTPRQMRPNPCHTRCQNRCHDIWTDGDRMGVFETYWRIPTEEERREWVAQRIERVDMATKRTEFSNFRTCTFKYYLPHPDNPWVQVCKNFFLATIDEKRSYIEKIAQSVKGETEKLSAKDIPFRRRNQMRSGAAGADFVGWMTGPGGEPVEMDAEGEGEMSEGLTMDLEEMHGMAD